MNAPYVHPDLYARFRRLFTYDEEKTLHVGVERESFITRDGVIVPHAKTVLEFLKVLTEQDAFSQLKDVYAYELSACQIEERTGPCKITEVEARLSDNRDAIQPVLEELGFSLSYEEVAPSNMPLDVYPEPSGRYDSLVSQMHPNVLSAACRIIGTHVHIGMPNHESALRVYNEAVSHWRDLAKLGDNSNGRRLAMYRLVKKDFEPTQYESWKHFYSAAIRDDFSENPRDNWKLIRLSRHGTIEFRMFGATESLKQVSQWANVCHRLCADILA